MFPSGSGDVTPNQGSLSEASPNVHIIGKGEYAKGSRKDHLIVFHGRADISLKWAILDI